jgi:oligopeptidase B
VDVLADMMDPSIPLTTTEYKEWGNPNVKEEYEYIKSYCPYTNVSAQAYPAMWVRESINDSQVQYWDAARWVAKLRAKKTDSNPLLLRMNMDAGHGGASGRYNAIRETAEDWAFVLWQLGLSASN